MQKCSLEEHKEFDSISYCQECKIYMCNKCEIHHSELFKKHFLYKIEKEQDFSEIFTGYCKEENHLEKLYYFCKTHNKLCCSSCIVKVKRQGNGQHTDCDVCNIEDIKDEKKSKLKENIKFLEDLSQNLQKIINELKEIFQKICKNKESLKLQIQKIFTKLRNSLNEREDELLLEVDKQFDNIYFDEKIINESEKLPVKVKKYLDEGKSIENQWNNNELNFLIMNV